MSKDIKWKAEIKIEWEDGTIETIEDHDFSDDLIGQIDYEIKDYKESKIMIEEEKNND
jgi:hypothetical protein|tara:strand:+ start:402 stop:575 length:174 start_codon:yes stop_codon:yes gene_type:complete